MKGAFYDVYSKAGIQDYRRAARSCANAFRGAHPFSFLLRVNDPHRPVRRFGAAIHCHVCDKLCAPQLYMGNGVRVPALPVWHTGGCGISDCGNGQHQHFASVFYCKLKLKICGATAGQLRDNLARSCFHGKGGAAHGDNLL